MKLIDTKYIAGDYFRHNPSWGIEDSPWKASLVIKILNSNSIVPVSICDIGCGAGKVLSELRHVYPHAELYGYDIAPDVSHFWSQYKQENINFYLGNFFELNTKTYDVILLLDVIEHIQDPFSFLSNLLGIANYYVFHIPLDISAINVLREKPILIARKKVMHINYFTKNLALSLLDECGFLVIDWQYSGAAFNAPRRTFKTKLANIPRRLLYWINKEIGVRALGGETLVVLAKTRT